MRRLGDLILTTPAIDALRHRFPQAHIALALTSEGEALLKAIAGVDQAFVFRRTVRDLATSRKLRESAFDCVVDFTGNDRSASLTFLSGAPRRIASHRATSKSRFRPRFYNELVACAVKEMHTIDYQLALLQPLGVSSRATGPRLELPPDAFDRASALVQREIGDEPFAVFHPGSTRPEKFWEPERWAEVIAFARDELQLRPVLSSGSSALELSHIAKLRKRLRFPVADLSGALDLLTLGALISRARLLVTVDSASMHLASAMKTPQVALFGPTNPFHWRPRTSPAAILFGAAREPLRHFQARAPKLPMNQISTEAVINAMHSMHTAPAASAV